MKDRELKKLYEEQKDKNSFLQDRASGLEYSLALHKGDIENLRDEIEKLKEEKAKLLDENIDLLCKMRHILEMDIGKRG